MNILRRLANGVSSSQVMSETAADIYVSLDPLNDPKSCTYKLKVNSCYQWQITGDGRASELFSIA